MKNMLKSINYVSFTTTVMPISHTHVYIYRNSSPNTGVHFWKAVVCKTKGHMGIMYFSILLHNFITWYTYTNTVFSAAPHVVEDGDDGPCGTETCHIAGHEIGVVEPGTTWRVGWRLFVYIYQVNTWETWGFGGSWSLITVIIVWVTSSFFKHKNYVITCLKINIK